MRRLASGVALAGSYAALGAVGLSVASFEQHVTLLWLPSGVALGGLYVFGIGMWPAVWLGALLANLSVGTELLICALIATGNTAAAVVGSRLLATAGFDPSLPSLDDVRLFAHRGVGSAAAVAATSGSMALVATGHATLADLPTVWTTWFMGDAAGALVAAPVLFALAGGALRSATRPAWPGIVLAPATLACATLGFLGSGGSAAVGAGASVFGVVATAAVYGLPLSALLAALLAIISQAGIIAGTGLFAALGPHVPTYTWAYVTLVATSAITVASVQAERVATQQREAELRAAALEAHRLESLGVIAAGVAHDFNNILQVISGYADLIAPQVEHGRAVERIRGAVERGATLCDQLEAYAGVVPQQQEALCLAGEIRAMAPLLTAGGPEGTRLVVHGEGPGPRITGDRSLLRQAVSAVVRNAVEAADEAGGGEVHLSLASGQLDDQELARADVRAPRAGPGPYGWVEVLDKGPGMSEETRRRLFEPFYTTRFLGRGLGMAAVAGIATSQGGAVWVQPGPDGGTVVRVAWPAASSPA